MRNPLGMAAGLLAMVLASAVQAGPAVTPLVSTDWLEANLGADGLVILDSRAVAAFAEAHIPGAQQTDYPGAWRTTRDDVPWVVPDIADLEAYLSGLGIGSDTSVVVVPAGTGSSEIGGSTWVYWVLKYLGHDAVALLDGGWAAWSGEGRPVEAGAAAPPAPANFVADLRPDILATTDYVAERLGAATIIIDARPMGQYVGDSQSGLVTRPGHIPGAINIDNALFYDADGNRYKTLEGIAALLPAAVADGASIIVYCNTGHWSSIVWFALHELLGYEDVRLYEGSIAAWSRNGDLPMVTGPNP